MNSETGYFIYVGKQGGKYDPKKKSFEPYPGYEKKKILGPVPDSVIGKMAYCGFCHKWVLGAVHKGNVRGIDIEQYKPSDNEKVLILVLESPHKDEFDDNLKPILPAQGITGRNIENLIGTRNFVDFLDKEYEYVVLLVNAVQYQTSCYYIFGKMSHELRDSVFRNLFCSKGLKDDFIKRIKKHAVSSVDNGFTIVNCCTKNLRSEVEKCLYNMFEKNDVIKNDCHPAFWRTYKQYEKDKK